MDSFAMSTDDLMKTGQIESVASSLLGLLKKTGVSDPVSQFLTSNFAMNPTTTSRPPAAASYREP